MKSSSGVSAHRVYPPVIIKFYSSQETELARFFKIEGRPQHDKVYVQETNDWRPLQTPAH